MSHTHQKFRHLQPWKPVVQNYAHAWTEEAVAECDAPVLFQVSVMDLVRGHNGKTLRECSVAEAVEETLDQLRRSDLMGGLRTHTGRPLWEAMAGYEVWPGWEDDPETGALRNRDEQYKLSMNPGVWDRMPTVETPMDNLFFGSVVAKTDTPMVSMEFACTAGRAAALAIATKRGVDSGMQVHKHRGYLPVAFAPLRAADALAFALGL